MLAIIFVISIFTVLLTYWLASLFSNLQPIERIISGG